MSVKLEPLGARILVRLRPMKAISTLIIVPDQRSTCREADVVAIGPEVRDISVGDVVIVNALSGQAVGDEVILPESAVLGFVEVAA